MFIKLLTHVLSREKKTSLPFSEVDLKQLVPVLGRFYQRHPTSAPAAGAKVKRFGSTPPLFHHLHNFATPPTICLD